MQDPGPHHPMIDVQDQSLNTWLPQRASRKRVTTELHPGHNRSLHPVCRAVQAGATGPERLTALPHVCLCRTLPEKVEMPCAELQLPNPQLGPGIIMQGQDNSNAAGPHATTETSSNPCMLL